jgi:glyoxylase-like metal-dependent hydrolase (beta-lactamase superfamily II)
MRGGCAILAASNQREQAMSVRLYAMTCGWITMPTSTFLKDEKGFLAVPVPSYLIEHPKGVVLFDTGLAADLASPDPLVRDAALGNRAARVKPSYKPGEDVASRLRAFGMDPARIQYLVTSHLHFDHVGGNALVPNARWLIQKREWHWACTDQCREAGHYERKLFDFGHDRVEVDGEHDIFGDGAVTCLPTYGHTPGHQSLRVSLEGGSVVLTADACYMRRSMEAMHLPGVILDAQMALEGYRRFAEMERAGMRLIFGHDPQQWNGINDGAVREVTIATLPASRTNAAMATPAG